MKKEMVFIFAGLLLLAIAAFFVIQHKVKNSLANNLEDIQNLKIPNFSLINPDLNNSLIENQSIFSCQDNNYSCFLEELKGCSASKISLVNESQERIEIEIKGLENETCLLDLKKDILTLNCNIPQKDLESDFNQEDILDITTLQQKIMGYC